MPKTKSLTAPARLNLLVHWLNGTYDEHVWGPNPLYGQPAPWGVGEGPEDVATWTDYAAVRRALKDFIESFDGSAGAAHLEVGNDPSPAWLATPAPEPTDEELGELEPRLQILLEQGFGENADTAFPASSLRFAVRSAGREKPTLSKFDVTENGSPLRKGLVKKVRDYEAAGAYVLQVFGPLLELVPFLVAHLLTAPGMVAVKRCKRIGCTHFIVTATAARGRPRTFCSDSCRVWSAELDQQRKQRRKK